MDNDELTEMKIMMARMETKLDMAIAQKERDHAELARDTTDHEARIRLLEKIDVDKLNDLEYRLNKIERVYWKAVGAATIVAGLLGAGFGQILSALGI